MSVCQSWFGLVMSKGRPYGLGCGRGWVNV